MTRNEAYKLLGLEPSCTDVQLSFRYHQMYYDYSSSSNHYKNDLYKNDLLLNQLIDAMTIICEERKLNTQLNINKIIKLSLKESIFGTNVKVIENGENKKLSIPEWSYFTNIIHKGRYKYIIETSLNSEYKVYYSYGLYSVKKDINISKLEFLFGTTKKVGVLVGEVDVKIPAFSLKAIKEGIVVKRGIPSPGVYLFKVKVK